MGVIGYRELNHLHSPHSGAMREKPGLTLNVEHPEESKEEKARVAHTVESRESKKETQKAADPSTIKSTDEKVPTQTLKFQARAGTMAKGPNERRERGLSLNWEQGGGGSFYRATFAAES